MNKAILVDPFAHTISTVKVGDYTEEGAIEALKNLCADEKFECRIHGVDDQEEKKND